MTDAQGLTGTDTVSIIVHEDPLVMHLVELTITVGVTVLTQSEIETLQQKMLFLLGDNVKLCVRDLRLQQKTGEAVLIFYVEHIVSHANTIINCRRKVNFCCRLFQVNGKTEIMPGLAVETALNDKLWRDRSIIGIPVTDVRTTVCQNKCSGHGTCNSETRACMCSTFWMPSVYYFWDVSDANCGELRLMVFLDLLERTLTCTVFYFFCVTQIGPSCMWFRV